MSFKVYKEPCKNCLLSPDRIVSPERAKDIIQSCAKSESHFICHKASINGKEICCKNFFDKFGHVSKSIRMANALDLVEFIEMEDSKKLISYKEQCQKKKTNH